MNLDFIQLDLSKYRYLIITANRLSEVDNVCAQLDKRGIPHHRLIGSMSSVERSAAIKEFGIGAVSVIPKSMIDGMCFQNIDGCTDVVITDQSHYPHAFQYVFRPRPATSVLIQHIP